MDSKVLNGFVAFGVLFFVLYAAIFLDPIEKINAACTPVVKWPGRVLSSAVRIGSPGSAAEIDQSFARYFNTCQLWVWNVAYRDQYQALKKSEKTERGEASK